MQPKAMPDCIANFYILREGGELGKSNSQLEVEKGQQNFDRGVSYQFKDFVGERQSNKRGRLWVNAKLIK